MIEREAKKLIKSSSYRHGDANSFSVPICDGVTLPGTMSPYDYLEMVRCDDISGRVLVLAPGNGGLAAACLHRGAEEVVALEYRPRFHGVIDDVMSLVKRGRRQKIGADSKFKLVTEFPENWDLGEFDLILWSEGVDEITRPKKYFEDLSMALATSGKLIIEIYHGKNGWVEKINSWRPTSDAMIAVAKECFGEAWTDKSPARKDNGRIYTLVKTAPEKELIEKISKAPSRSEFKIDLGEKSPEEVDSFLDEVRDKLFEHNNVVPDSEDDEFETLGSDDLIEDEDD